MKWMEREGFLILQNVARIKRNVTFRYGRVQRRYGPARRSSKTDLSYVFITICISKIIFTSSRLRNFWLGFCMPQVIRRNLSWRDHCVGWIDGKILSIDLTRPAWKLRGRTLFMKNGQIFCVPNPYGHIYRFYAFRGCTQIKLSNRISRKIYSASLFVACLYLVRWLKSHFSDLVRWLRGN